MTSEFGIAVHALVYLNHKARTLSSEELAENICTNPARVRKIMAVLKKAGLIETKEGAEGGYLFCRKAEEVTLCEVGKALGTAFVSVSWKSGSDEMDCFIASGMAGIMDGIYARLNGLCGEHLKGITIKDIDDKIFSGKMPGGALKK